MSEFALIARHFKRAPRDASVRLGVGDDAALVAPAPGCELVLAADMMVEGRHFLPDADPASLGHKVLAVNLSDLAAMGARPRWALLACALPEADDRWLGAFSRGFFALAEKHGVDLVGGDTTRGPRNLCVTIAGEVPVGAAIRRDGARAGDDLWVSGTLGDAMLGLASLQGRVRLYAAAHAACTTRLAWPVPRVSLGIALRGAASAMLDVSDGLAGDLAHIVEASRVGAVVELASIPRSEALDALLRSSDRALALACLVAGGDDYELLFTAPAAKRERVEAAGREAKVAVTRIGRIVAGTRIMVNDERGAPLDPLPRGFDHFAGESG